LLLQEAEADAAGYVTDGDVVDQQSPTSVGEVWVAAVSHPLCISRLVAIVVLALFAMGPVAVACGSTCVPFAQECARAVPSLFMDMCRLVKKLPDVVSLLRCCVGCEVRGRDRSRLDVACTQARRFRRSADFHAVSRYFEPAAFDADCL
jgi:hypothetical protein